MTDGCVYYDPKSASKILSRFKERLICIQREKEMKMRMKVKDCVKDLVASTLTPEEFQQMMESCKGGKPIGAVEDVVLNTANLFKEVLKVYDSESIYEEDFMLKLQKIADRFRASSQNRIVSVVKDQDERKLDSPQPNKNESKANFGKDFARGDHPSRSGATYCAVDEAPKRQPRRWNGPGMKMLPPLYGESLHHHKKFVDVSEDWEIDQEYFFEKYNDDVTATSSNHSGNNTFLPPVPLYVPKENEQNYTEQEKKLNAVAEKYRINEMSTPVNDKVVLWFSFQRPGSERREIVFLVILNGSYYIWYEWLIEKFADNRKLNLLTNKNPANCEDVKSKLASMVEQRLEDLTLTTLRNFDLLWGVDEDLAAVLEVYHYSWKNPRFKIKFFQ